MIIDVSGKRKFEYLEVKIGKNTHKVPLGPYTSYKFGVGLRKVRKSPAEDRDMAMFDYLADYVSGFLGDDVDLITTGDMAEIIRAWSEASEEGGASEGE